MALPLGAWGQSCHYKEAQRDPPEWCCCDEQGSNVWSNTGAEGAGNFSGVLIAFCIPLRLPAHLWEHLDVWESYLQKEKAMDGPNPPNLSALCTLTFGGFINTSPCSLQCCRNPHFGECRGSLNLLYFRRIFSSFTRDKWNNLKCECHN